MKYKGITNLRRYYDVCFDWARTYRSKTHTMCADLAALGRIARAEIFMHGFGGGSARPAAVHGADLVQRNLVDIRRQSDIWFRTVLLVGVRYRW